MRKLTALVLAFLLSLPHSAYAVSPITFDTSTTNHTASSATATYAFSVGVHSDRVLIVAFTANKLSLPAVSSVTYGGDAMTASAFTPQALPTDTTVKVYYYYLLNPKTGSNNVVITFASSVDEVNSSALSYYNVGSLPQNMHVNGTGTSGTLTTTTTIDNSWLTGICRNNSSGDGSAGTGTTRRSDIAGQNAFYDSGGAKSPTGSYSIISTFGSTQYGCVGMTLAPVVPVTAVVLPQVYGWW